MDCWQVSLYACYAYLTADKQNDDISKKLSDKFTLPCLGREEHR